MKQNTKKILVGLCFGMAAVTGLSTISVDNAYAEQTVPDGTYIITVPNTNRVLDVQDGSTKSGGVLWTYPFGGIDNEAQKFKIEYQKDQDAYTIQNLKSNLLVSFGAISFNDPVIEQRENKMRLAQLWKIEKHNNNYYIKTAKPDTYRKYLSREATAFSPCVLLYDSYNSEWGLEKIDEYSFGKVLPDGDYYIQMAGTNSVIDVPNASKKPNQKLNIYPFNGTRAQQFHLSYDETTQRYTIMNINSSLILDTASYSKNEPVFQSTSIESHNAQWQIAKKPNGQYVFWTENYGLTGEQSAAFWNFGDEACKTALKLGIPTSWNIYPVNQYKIQDGNYYIYSSAGKRKFSKIYYFNGVKAESLWEGHLSLDVKNGSKKNQANVQLYRDNHTLAQMWIIKQTNNNYYTITNVGSGKCLDVKNASTKNGTNLWQYTANGTLAQQWIIDFDDNGYATISSRLSPNKVVDVASASYKDGTNIQLWTSNKTKAQKWIITNQYATTLDAA